MDRKEFPALGLIINLTTRMLSIDRAEKGIC